MSKYYAYDEMSGKYDSNRFADGVEIMTFMLAGMLKKKAAEIHILEAGCGTGNFSNGFLKNGIGKVTMIDASNGMIAIAKKKVEEYGDRVVELKQHKLPSLPFCNESFDVVTFIQVLHHLDSSGVPEGVAVNIKERYKNVCSAIKESYRVLKPGGVLLIDHCFQKNVEGISQWLTSAPKAFALFKEIYMPEKDLINLMKDEKFENVLYVTRPGSTCMKNDNHVKAENLIDKDRRDTDSMWSFPERTGELPAILDLIYKAKEEGKLSQLENDMNRLLYSSGHSTMLFGQK